MKSAVLPTVLWLCVGICLCWKRNTVVPTCGPEEDVCHTSLYLRRGRTGITGPMAMVGDGIVKEVMVYNDSLPGPPIVVYEGQQVVVRVHNQLTEEATTVHWHGLYQNNTPWMDGVDGVSHCPINPGESFLYRFLASPTGTHWYHSHYGTQRTMGAAGPLIVLPRDKKKENRLRGSDPLPEFEEEFVLVVTDWMRNYSIDITLMVHYEMVSYPYGYDNDKCFESTKQADGLDCGVYPYMSGLINGKGRYYIDGQSVVNTTLEHFKVKPGKKYRFRVICTSMLFGLRLSIDGHELNVIATDGSDVITRTVESLVVTSGERYDFWIHANDPQETGSYWIRAETLEQFQDHKPVHPGQIRAILQYKEGGEPTTTRRECSETRPCTILNCPYQSYLESEHLQCIHITDLQAAGNTKTLKPGQEKIVEHFLNFHYIEAPRMGVWKPTINGFANVLPPSPYQIQGSKSKPCDYDTNLANYTMCPHVLQVPLGSIVQLVISITISNAVGIMNGVNHPVHIHGQNLQVLKIGFPTYDKSTNFFQSLTSDIECENPLNCNRIHWTNASWADGNVEGILEVNPPLKDTILVPVGGYVVARFKANKPGYWYMHCHVEFHNNAGMSLVIKEGTDDQISKPPAAINTCGDFFFPQNNQASEDPFENCPESTDELLFYMWTTGALLIYSMSLLMCRLCEGKVLNSYDMILTQTEKSASGRSASL